MAENDNSFWDKKEDDFWSKPVMSESWLEEDKNPYVRERETEPLKGFQYQTEEPQQKPYQPVQGRSTKASANKVRHAHTIICLIFMAAAAASVAGTLILSAIQKKAAKQEAQRVEYAESAEADEVGYIKCYDNGVVFLEDKAYTVYDAGTYPVNPERKLIAIHMEAVSDQYEYGHDSMEQCYVGYDTLCGREYSGAANSDKLVPYIVKYGYTPEEMLSTMGIANGCDAAGYYFFYIPQEVTELTLYCEKREKVKGISKLLQVYTKSYKVIRE